MPNDPDKQPVDTPPVHPRLCSDILTPSLTTTGTQPTQAFYNFDSTCQPVDPITYPVTLVRIGPCEWDADLGADGPYHDVDWFIQVTPDPTGTNAPLWRLFFTATLPDFTQLQIEYDNITSDDGAGTYFSTDPCSIPSSITLVL